MLSGALTPSALRIILAGSILTLLAWQTAYRLFWGDDDPSVDFGGDWVLIRVSGMPLIATAVGIVGLALSPEITGSKSGAAIAAGLAGIIVLWYIIEWRESHD